jgi:DNA-binding beta-propeller fold protein YncE
MERAGRAALGGALCWAALVAPSGAEIAVSGNDGKATLAAGVQVVPAEVVPDTVSIIDLSASPPRVVGEVEAPASVAGPPLSVAVAPDESFALVTAAQKLDPADPRKYAPDNRLSVVDLRASPPRVVATHAVGPGAAGVSLNRAGTLALVANRNEGTVSVFSVRDGALTERGKVRLGDEKSGPSAIAFTRDGRTAYVTRDGDWRISVLSVAGDTVTYTKRDLFAGIRPYGIDIAGDGALAAVANIGMGLGDADTVSLVDLKAEPSRVVTTVTVGQTPEGLKLSPDGTHLAVGVINGSNKASTSPFYNDRGLLKVYRVAGHALTQVAEAPVGHWCQGIAWSRDGRTLVTQCMIEREILSFAFDGASLKPTGTIRMKNGPAGIRTAEP